MRHYKELKFEKDNTLELEKVLLEIENIKANKWSFDTNLRDKFSKESGIPNSKLISLLSPHYTHIISDSENKIFRGLVHIGIQNNSIKVIDIFDQFNEKKMPALLFNYVLHNFIQDIVIPNPKIFSNYTGTVEIKRDKPVIPTRKTSQTPKKLLVISTNPEKFEIFNYRTKKPIHYTHPKGEGEGEVLFQASEELIIDKKNKIDYFTPNNIALLLSVSNNALQDAKVLLKQIKKKNEFKDKIEEVKFSTSLICDYIEKIQTAIVFTYTTLEAFVNLSIPEEYEYCKIAKEAGVSYEKKYKRDSIERLIPLKEKLTDVLPDIYDTKQIEKEKFFGRFANLEELRNKIIHQKSIEHTELYNDYFKESIFDFCKVSEDIIDFFYENCKNDFSTNPMWPWIKGKKENLLPRAEYRAEDFIMTD